MKRTLIIIIVLLLTLTLFMSSALAGKPADKPINGPEQSEEPDGEEPDGSQDPKKPNEKRDAKKLFKLVTRPLIDEVHANQEEWGALGDSSGDIGDLIEAKIDEMIAGGAQLTPEQIALIKANIEEIKALKVQMRDFNKVVHMDWKKYIAAKKISDVGAGVAALNDLIAMQEIRIGLRGQIMTIMNELAVALGIVVPPVVPPVVPVVPAA